MRKILCGIGLAISLLVAPHTATAQTTNPPITPPTALPIDTIDAGRCVKLGVPQPNCGVEPQASGDRGGSAQLALFGILMAAMAGIGLRVAYSTRRRTNQRAASAAEK